MNFNYIDKLIRNCNSAKKANPVDEFVLNLDDLSKLDNINKNAIYTIEELDGNKDDTFEKMKEYKNKYERKCPKLNIASNIMYIGSSTTNLKKRIKEHMGEGHKSTYSLQLKHWFYGKYQITVKLYDEDKDVIQIIEDNLSYNLLPAFGKLGSNNK